MTAPFRSTPSSPRSRRALLAGALGGLGAVLANAVGRATPARAGVDGDVVLGSPNNVATTTTAITNTVNDNTVLLGDTNFGIAVLGRSSAHYGVAGTSISGNGVLGSSDSATGSVGWSRGDGTGLLGFSTPGPDVLIEGKAKTGVFGRAGQDATSKGVWGSSPAGHGLHGESTSGVGLFATATSGLALQTSGRVKLSTSGVATINAGSTSKTVTPGVNVTSGSFVLLTPKANIGSRALWFTSNATANTFTIRMSSSRGINTKVAWLLLG